MLSSFWVRSLATLLVAALLSLVAWPVTGPVGSLWLFCVLLLAILLFHLRQIARLVYWVQHPSLDSVPECFGSWELVFNHLYQMMREQTRSQQKLTNTLDRFVSAGEAMPDGVVVLNEKDRIEWCNPVAMHHLNLDRRRDVGQQISYLVRQPDFVDYLGRQDFSQPLLLRTGRNQERLLSMQLVPFDVSRKLLISRDVTQLDRVQTVLRDFVANVSHELRTPLTVVGGFLETLLDLDDADPAVMQRYMQLMQVQTDRMKRLVDDLLTLSRLESNVQVASDDPVNMPQLLQTLLAEAQGLSQQRHRIELSMEGDRWLLGCGDELHSALGNLVSNAIRYTPAGGTIRLAWRDGADGATFSVADSGIGIEAKHISRLTERFYRVDRGRSRETGGTGLGLAIVKHVLMRHQAALEIHSEPGKGSQFLVRFPVQRLLAPSLAE